MFRKSSLALAAVLALGIVSPSFAQDWSAANKEAVALYQKGNVEGAIAKAGEATAAYAKVENFKSATYLQLLNLRLDLLSLIDNPKGDLAALNEGIEVITNHEGAKSDRLIPLYQNIYYVYQRTGDKNNVAKAMESLVAFGENAYGKTGESMGMMWVQIAAMVKPYDGKEAAMSHLKTAQAMMAANYPISNKSRTAVEMEIAKSYMGGGDLKSAEDAFNALLAGLEAAPGETKVSQKQALVFLVNLYNRINSKSTKNANSRSGGKKSEGKLMASLVKLSALMGEEEHKTAVIRSSPKFKANSLKGAKRGIIKLRFNINKKGFMTSIKVLEKNGDRKFEKAVLREASLWRFAPKVENGKAVFSSGYEVEYKFKPTAARR